MKSLHFKVVIEVDDWIAEGDVEDGIREAIIDEFDDNVTVTPTGDSS